MQDIYKIIDGGWLAGSARPGARRRGLAREVLQINVVAHFNF